MAGPATAGTDVYRPSRLWVRPGLPGSFRNLAQLHRTLSQRPALPGFVSYADRRERSSSAERPATARVSAHQRTFRRGCRDQKRSPFRKPIAKLASDSGPANSRRENSPLFGKNWSRTRGSLARDQGGGREPPQFLPIVNSFPKWESSRPLVSPNSHPAAALTATTDRRIAIEVRVEVFPVEE